MNYLMQMQRAVDFIEARLHVEITAAEVARHARISQWHFQRIFKALTHDTLKAYIRSRRLAKAAAALHASPARIIDVALASGFDSQASFTRAFMRAFDVTPARYRAMGNRRWIVPKVRFDEDYVRHLHNQGSLQPKVFRQPALQLVGLQSTFFGSDSDRCNVGRKLPPLWAAFLARLHEVPHAIRELCYGVIAPARDHEQLTYVACIAVSRRAAIPRGMIALRLPAAQYAQFVHRGLPKDLDTTVNYIYSNWLTRSKLRHTYAPDVESYGVDFVEASSASVIRYAIPVR